MIRLNLTNIPGLQAEGGAAEIDFEGLEPATIEKPPESPTETPPETVPAEPEVTEETPSEIDEDIFKMAEDNLDLLEQAEKEEFAPKHVSEESEEERVEGRPVRVKGKRNVIIMLLVVAVLIIIGGGFWAYRAGLFTKGEVTETARAAKDRVSQTVTERSDEFRQRAGKVSEDVSRKAADLKERIPETAEPRAQRIPEAPLRTAPPRSGPGEVTPADVRRILSGNLQTEAAAELMERFPPSAKLQYFKLSNGKISFLLYTENERLAQEIRAHLSGGPQFREPEVFFIDRNNRYADNPVEIMAIIPLRSFAGEVEQGIQYFNDQQISQITWGAAKRANVSIRPVRISSRDVYTERNGEISGQSQVHDLANYLHKLATYRSNMSVSGIYINNTICKKIYESALAFRLDLNIYPRSS